MNQIKYVKIDVSGFKDDNIHVCHFKAVLSRYCEMDSVTNTYTCTEHTMKNVTVAVQWR